MDIIINKKVVSIPVLPVIAAIALLALVLSTMRIARVQAREIGIFVNNITGNVTVRTQKGSSFYNGLITDFYTVRATEQILEMVGDDSVRVKTKDGSDVQLDIRLSYRIIASEKVIRDAILAECGLEKVRAPWVSKTEPVDAYNVVWIREYARSVIRHVFGELTTSEFYNKSELRDAKARQSEKELNELLEKHGIRVERVVPDRFRFYDEYEGKIMAKKAADQEVKSQEKLAEAAAKEQEKEIVKAQAITKVEIAKMEGEFRKELLASEAEAAKDRLGAEAYAYANKTEADAKFTKVKNEALAAFAIAEAEAKGLQQLAESLAGEGGKNLVKLEFAKVLKRAKIVGVPYATDPRIQKVQIDTTPAKPQRHKAVVR